MPVDRTPRTLFFSGKDQAQRSAREQLKFILANENHLLKIRGGDKKLSAAKNMSAQKDPLTDNQISFIDSIYESTMRGAGFESVPTHHDIVKTLRY